MVRQSKFREWIIKPMDREHLADILFRNKDDMKFIELCDEHNPEIYDLEKMGELVLEDDKILFNYEDAPEVVLGGSDIQRLAENYRNQGTNALVSLPLIIGANSIYVDPRRFAWSYVRVIDGENNIVKKVNARYYAGDILLVDPPNTFRVTGSRKSQNSQREF